jgi:hypothetical protein
MTEQPNLNLTRVASIETAIESAKEGAGVGDASLSKLADKDEPSNTGVSDTDTDAPPPRTWREGLPDDLRNTPSLAKFKDVESLAKSYLEGEKAFSSRVAVPREDAPDADWDAFYRRVGRPEDKRYRPDGLTVSEEEEPLLARYEEILHDSGLTRRQGQKMLAHMADLSASMEGEAKAQGERLRAENLAILEKAFGDQMDLKVNQIKAALGQFGATELSVLVEQTNYNPALVQFLSSVGEKLASDRLVTGDAPPSPTSRETALAEIKRLELDEDFQVNYRGSDVEKRQEAVNRMNALYKAAY